MLPDGVGPSPVFVLPGLGAFVDELLDFVRGDLQVPGFLAKGGDHGRRVGLEEIQHPAQVHQFLVHLLKDGKVARVVGGRLQEAVEQAHGLEQVAQGLGGVEVVIHGRVEPGPQRPEPVEFLQGQVVGIGVDGVLGLQVG